MRQHARNDPRDVYDPISLDDSTLAERIHFLQVIGDRHGTLDRAMAERAIRAAAAHAHLEARRTEQETA